ncbi:MAG: small basic protein [Planctomycetota bacterium]|jgi:small basic protein (TIGR04137 family)
MSIDRSLKSMKGLARHRNVLSRAERIKRMTDEDKWDESQSLFGLPKIANRNLRVGKKTKKEKEQETTGEVPEEEKKDEAAAGPEK